MPESLLREEVSLQLAAFMVGPDGQLSFPYLLRLWQEAAMRNTVRLGLDSPTLRREQGLTWVLRRQHTTCIRFPAMGEQLRILTEPLGVARRLRTFRVFHLLDEVGETLATTMSEWWLMDIETHRLRRIPVAIVQQIGETEVPAYMNTENDIIMREASPEAGAHILRAMEQRIGWHHLDFNHHLTNAAFAELLLAPLATSFRQQHQLEEVYIDFLREVRCGESLRATVQGRAQRWWHTLQRAGETVATMQTTWRK